MLNKKKITNRIYIYVIYVYLYITFINNSLSIINLKLISDKVLYPL